MLDTFLSTHTVAPASDNCVNVIGTSTPATQCTILDSTDMEVICVFSSITCLNSDKVTVFSIMVEKVQITSLQYTQLIINIRVGTC